jgi:RNA-directed DNA polymerase
VMHGHEKSDPAIVAVKLANEGGQPPEERVEPRAGAEGNTEQHGRHRTPSRESLSHGLDRVRQAARTRKQERFTALLHHVDVELLRSSYGWLRKEAAPGVDGVTWDAYGEGLERKLEDLHDRIHRGASGHSRPVGFSFRNPTEGSAPWALRRWRTKSSSARWWKC